MDIPSSSAPISGGASGLGAATARHLAGLGARVTIADLNHVAGLALAQELGGRFVEADVADEASVRQAIAAAVAAQGGLHILVCCAGVATPGKVLGKDGPLDLDQFARVVRINLIGSFNAIRLAAEQMVKNEPNAEGERGVIITTASVAAFEGQIGQAAYSASKAGVAAMTLPIARELARYGIRVVSIAPGIFDTPMLAGLPEPARVSLGQQVPFPPRLGRPDEYAALAQHIIENTMLNGETIRLDGAIRMAPR
ncbi:MAG TPA: SDR family NAD(P)-dependent oxidoreductase [Roseiflexaceae bacterium]|nr:SDR family NAD(P)-dependent oxidoreductase [Roseiflexaceae bacterium]